jgi:hypothetical protein
MKQNHKICCYRKKHPANAIGKIGSYLPFDSFTISNSVSFLVQIVKQVTQGRQALEFYKKFHHGGRGIHGEEGLCMLHFSL